MKTLLLVVVLMLVVWFLADNWHGIGLGVDAFKTSASGKP